MKYATVRRAPPGIHPGRGAYYVDHVSPTTRRLVVRVAQVDKRRCKRAFRALAALSGVTPLKIRGG